MLGPVFTLTGLKWRVVVVADVLPLNAARKLSLMFLSDPCVHPFTYIRTNELILKQTHVRVYYVRQLKYNIQMCLSIIHNNYEP